MALKHACHDEVIDLYAGLDEPGAERSTSLLRTPHLQLIRLVLKAGSTLREHQVRGEITVQCLRGEAEVSTPDSDCPLRPGQLVAVPAGEPHAVTAHADCLLLLTVLHRGPEPEQAPAIPI